MGLFRDLSFSFITTSFIGESPRVLPSLGDACCEQGAIKCQKVIITESKKEAATAATTTSTTLFYDKK